MNSIKTSPRGFPFDELTLQELQDQSQPYLNAIAKLVPDRSIVYGCENSSELSPDGTQMLLTRLDGFIVWDGELLPFKGGAWSEEFSIVQQTQNRTFNVGTKTDPLLEDHPAYVHRWAQVGNVVGAVSVHQLSDLNPAPRFLNYLAKGTAYIGSVVPMFKAVNGLGGSIVNVQFQTALPTSSYMVFSSFYRADGFSADFDYDVFDKSNTGFFVRIRNISQPINTLIYQYLTVPSDLQLKFAAQTP